MLGIWNFTAPLPLRLFQNPLATEKDSVSKSPPVNSPETPIDIVRRKPETRTGPRLESDSVQGEFEPRYVDVPRRRRAQLAAERNLKWGLAVLLLSLGLVGAALIVSGPRALVPIVICLVTLTILWTLARLRVFHQRNGVFFATTLVCLLGATVPMIQRGYEELDRMAHSPSVEPAPIAAAPASVVEPKPAAEKPPESVAAFDPNLNLPSLVEAFKIPEPTDPDANLVRIIERTKVMIGRKAYLLNAGDTFTLEDQKDGLVFFRANEHRLSVSERVVELMAPATPESSAADEVQAMPPRLTVPPPLKSRVSDQDLDGATTARAQAEAVRRYPPIGVKGTVENALFVEQYKKMKDERPEFLDDEEWPLYLADGLAKEHGWTRVK